MKTVVAKNRSTSPSFDGRGQAVIALIVFWAGLEYTATSCHTKGLDFPLAGVAFIQFKAKPRGASSLEDSCQSVEVLSKTVCFVSFRLADKPSLSVSSISGS